MTHIFYRLDSAILTTEDESILAAAGPEGYLLYRHGSMINEMDGDNQTADIEVIDNDTNALEEEKEQEEEDDNADKEQPSIEKTDETVENEMGGEPEESNQEVKNEADANVSIQ